MYFRKPGSMLNIENKEEEKYFIQFINDKILKHNIFTCRGLKLADKTKIVTDAACVDPNGKVRSMKVIGQFPYVKLQDINGAVIGDAEFKTPTQFTIAAKPVEELKKIQKVTKKEEVKKEIKVETPEDEKVITQDEVLEVLAEFQVAEVAAEVTEKAAEVILEEPEIFAESHVIEHQESDEKPHRKYRKRNF